MIDLCVIVPRYHCHPHTYLYDGRRWNSVKNSTGAWQSTLDAYTTRPRHPAAPTYAQFHRVLRPRNIARTCLTRAALLPAHYATTRYASDCGRVEQARLLYNGRENLGSGALWTQH